MERTRGDLLWASGKMSDRKVRRSTNDLVVSVDDFIAVRSLLVQQGSTSPNTWPAPPAAQLRQLHAMWCGIVSDPLTTPRLRAQAIMAENGLQNCHSDAGIAALRVARFPPVAAGSGSLLKEPRQAEPPAPPDRASA